MGTKIGEKMEYCFFVNS